PNDVVAHHRVALALRHLLAVRVGDETADGGTTPRQAVVLQVGTHDPGEQPGPDDVVRLRCEVHREGDGEPLRVPLPTAHDLWGQRRGGPGVHHVRVTHEPAGLPALVLAEPGRAVAGRVHRQGVL